MVSSRLITLVVRTYLAVAVAIRASAGAAGVAVLHGHQARGGAAGDCVDANEAAGLGPDHAPVPAGDRLPKVAVQPAPGLDAAVDDGLRAAAPHARAQRQRLDRTARTYVPHRLGDGLQNAGFCFFFW